MIICPDTCTSTHMYIYPYNNVCLFKYFKHVLFLFITFTEIKRIDKRILKSTNTHIHTWGNNKGISLQKFNFLAAFHMVCQENVSLFSWEHPVGVYVNVLLCWWNQPEYFLSMQDVVPHRGATKINVEICVTSLHAHQTIPVKISQICWHCAFQLNLIKYNNQNFSQWKTPPQLRFRQGRNHLPMCITEKTTYFWTLGYFIFSMILVDSVWHSFKCLGHTVSTQSICLT